MRNVLYLDTVENTSVKSTAGIYESPFATRCALFRIEIPSPLSFCAYIFCVLMTFRSFGKGSSSQVLSFFSD